MLTFFFASLFAFLLVSSCRKGKERPLNIIDDDHRNWYEIALCGFFDADAKGAETLFAIAERLDRLKEMGFNGIRLAPLFADGQAIALPFPPVARALKHLAAEAHARELRILLMLPERLQTSDVLCNELAAILRGLEECGIDGFYSEEASSASEGADALVSELALQSREGMKMAGGILAAMNGSFVLRCGGELGTVEAADGIPLVTREEHPSEGAVDPESILCYYKKAMKLRNQFPSLARGAAEAFPVKAQGVCVLRKTWDEETITLVINPKPSAQTVTLDKEALGYKALAAELTAKSTDRVKDRGYGRLQMPPYSIAILE